ncbi:hypothetical protein [Bradyrhizobium japonicum]|uniref:hypothetical protein n=1 Tax=Bradyrhizobium japonicum TaxID=375 RepID=UPI001BAD001B|nr:hypothetical protein [Bradyrhizobium japonicum]MBR0908381.1 hypothetical protein [Bradyrhizobium japonicum]
MSFASNAIFSIWPLGMMSLSFADAWFIRQMRRNLAPGLAQFKGFSDSRLEGRRPALWRDPSAYSEQGRRYRRWAIVVELLFLPWFFGGLLLWASR